MTLPDCTRCGGPVRLDVDGQGPVEACQRCGLAQRPIPPNVDRAEIRAAVRASRVRRLLGPSCLGRRHPRCTASGCECTCHDQARAAALLAAETPGHLDPDDVPG